MPNRHIDWNDVCLMLAVARTGSFLKAAAELGCDQTTVSRRVAALEKRAGYPLFHRTARGSQPTSAAEALIEAAAGAAVAISQFERLLDRQVAPITVSSPEGLANYLIVPCLSGSLDVQPLGMMIAEDMPRLTFLPLGMHADIAIIPVEPGQPVKADADAHIQRVARLRFVLTGGIEYLRRHGAPDRASDLSRHSVLQHSVYDANSAFRVWTDVIHSGSGPVLTTPTTTGLHRATLSGMGLSLLPNFSHLLDTNVLLIDCHSLPQVPVDIYISAQPDALRIASVRTAYNALAALLRSSPWLRLD